MSDGVVFAAGVVATGSPDPTQPITTTTINVTTGAMLPDGTKLSPSWQWTSDADGTGTGMYRRAANVITTAINGVDSSEESNNRFTTNSATVWGWSSSTTTVNANDTTIGRQSAGLPVIDGATATPAGGAVSLGLVFGSTAGFGIYIGSGLPTLSAAQGSIYLRSDGSSTSTRLYVNTNGTTGWTNVTTAA